MIRYKGINHLAMITGDMDKTIHFWRDLLGMRLVAGLGKPGYRHYFFEISPDDLLAFFEWPRVEPKEEKDHGYPIKGRHIFDHVSFGVATINDLWNLQDRLTDAGYPVSGVIDHGFILSIYSWDPNGIPIEFTINAENIDIRTYPEMLDKLPTQAAQEGSDPQPRHLPEPQDHTPHKKRKIFPGAGSELFHGIKDSSSK